MRLFSTISTKLAHLVNDVTFDSLQRTVAVEFNHGAIVGRSDIFYLLGRGPSGGIQVHSNSYHVGPGVLQLLCCWKRFLGVYVGRLICDQNDHVLRRSPGSIVVL